MKRNGIMPSFCILGNWDWDKYMCAAYACILTYKLLIIVLYCTTVYSDGYRHAILFLEKADVLDCLSYVIPFLYCYFLLTDFYLSAYSNWSGSGRSKESIQLFMLVAIQLFRNWYK